MQASQCLCKEFQEKHHLLAVLWMSDEICFCDREMSEPLVHVGATGEWMDLEQIEKAVISARSRSLRSLTKVIKVH